MPTVVVKKFIALPDVFNGYQVNTHGRRHVNSIWLLTMIQPISWNPHTKKPVWFRILDCVAPLVGILGEAPQVVLDVFAARYDCGLPLAPAKLFNVFYASELYKIRPQNSGAKDCSMRDILGSKEPRSKLRRPPLNFHFPPLLGQTERVL